MKLPIKNAHTFHKKEMQYQLNPNWGEDFLKDICILYSFSNDSKFDNRMITVKTSFHHTFPCL